MKKNTEYIIPELSTETKNQPAWLRERKEVSRVDFNKAALPPRGLHLWRYTDPGRFMFEIDQPVDAPYEGDPSTITTQLKTQLDKGSLDAFVVDSGGHDIKTYGTDKFTDDGIIITSLRNAIEQHHDLVKSNLYQLVNNQTGKFEAMNGALWQDGIFIFVPDGKSIKKPLHLVRQGCCGDSASFGRLLVIASKNSKLTIIDEYSGGSEDFDNSTCFTNSAVEIFAAPESYLRYVSLQRQNPGVSFYCTMRAKLAESAKMFTVPMSLGAGISKQNFGIFLNGTGSQSDIQGLLFGSGRQHFDNHTLHHHATGQTFSNINFKVVLKDRADSAYTGLIRIENDARNCEAYQENRNLLLNKGTNAETIPELEILNEDVSCSHGATIGPIDEETIFFLMARGIDRAAAVRMIVSGFLAPVLNQVPADLREQLSSIVTQRLENI